MRRVPRFLILAAALPAATACEDPTDLVARNAVVSDTLTVYALTGTSFTLPSAINLPEITILRATGAFNFDIGFDINDEGRVELIPIELLASDLADVHDVGLQVVEGSTFEDLTLAPTSGYTTGEILTVEERDVVAVRVTAPRYCSVPFPEIIYAKMIVDSITEASRAIHFRVVVDPSCGFRSFLPGIPTQ